MYMCLHVCVRRGVLALMCVCVCRCVYQYAHISECVTGQSYFDPLSLYTCQSYCHNWVQS